MHSTNCISVSQDVCQAMHLTKTRRTASRVWMTVTNPSRSEMSSVSNAVLQVRHQITTQPVQSVRVGSFRITGSINVSQPAPSATEPMISTNVSSARSRPPSRIIRSMAVSRLAQQPRLPIIRTIARHAQAASPSLIMRRIYAYQLVAMDGLPTTTAIVQSVGAKLRMQITEPINVLQIAILARSQPLKMTRVESAMANTSLITMCKSV